MWAPDGPPPHLKGSQGKLDSWSHVHSTTQSRWGERHAYTKRWRMRQASDIPAQHTQELWENLSVATPASTMAVYPPWMFSHSLPTRAPAVAHCTLACPPCLTCVRMTHLLHHVLIGLDGCLLAGHLVKLAREGPSAACGQNKM